ncbi:ommochrome-binding protein-like [Cydia strobilella]|uniref:ommochrome-binding protein-like n=1 Tax=Cydia strobilella TaxID=1100964 RepID=UPI003004C066
MLLLILIISSASAQTFQQFCLPFHNNYYQPIIVKEGVKDVQKLVLNRNDNTLYFIFNKVGDLGYSLGYVNLNTNLAGVVDGIRNASSVTVDQVNNVVYAGGKEGLYIVKSIDDRKELEKMPVFHDIFDIFFKGVLYFSTKRREAFRVRNNVVYRLPALAGVSVEKIVLDDDNNILFTANRKLFRLKLGTRDIAMHEDLLVDGIAVDEDFIPFVTTTQGIYVYNKYKYALDPVSNERLRSLNALTFSKEDELIYEAAGNIYKLARCQ